MTWYVATLGIFCLGAHAAWTARPGLGLTSLLLFIPLGMSTVLAHDPRLWLLIAGAMVIELTMLSKAWLQPRVESGFERMMTERAMDRRLSQP